MCLSHFIYTVRPCLIHICHAMPKPCSDHAVLLKATAQHGRREMAVLCCGLERNGMVGAWHGKCESDTAALCTSNTFQTLSSTACGRGMAWARHAMCESALKVLENIRMRTQISATYHKSESRDMKTQTTLRKTTNFIILTQLYTQKPQTPLPG